MEQWDIMCCKCGEFILTEQQEKTGNIKCVKGSYDDGFYDGSEDQFYCKGCAEKYNKNDDFIRTKGGGNMKWNEVPKFTEYELVNPTCFGFVSYVDFIENEIKEYNLNMNPGFQRGHVWTEIQQSKYVEFILKGGKSGRDFYFNWNPDTNDYVCVDGLQRTTALQNFVHNKLKAFGQFFDEFSFTRYTAAYNPLPEYHVNVYRNSLKTKREILQWYVDMNAGGTPHTNEEIERIKKMIENL